MTQNFTKKTVAVLDYGSGNVHSALKALNAAGAIAELTADEEKIFAADGLLVPGVGAFNAVMQQLQNVNGAHLIFKRLAAAKKVLGICVGQQILFESGTERASTVKGLGYFTGRVQKLKADTLPHMGWNHVHAAADSNLFANIEHKSFYFVHSNAAVEEVRLGPEWQKIKNLTQPTIKLTTAVHEGAKFIAAIEAGPLSATQFHPEKSGVAGLTLLQNWVATL